MTENNGFPPRANAMRPYRFTRGMCDLFGETFDIMDGDGVFIASVPFRCGAGAAEAKAKLIVAALNAYGITDDRRMTPPGPYRYTREKDGCDEVFAVVDESGADIMAVHFWEAVEAAEANASLIVGALNSYSEAAVLMGEGKRERGA